MDNNFWSEFWSEWKSILGFDKKYTTNDRQIVESLIYLWLKKISWGLVGTGVLVYLIAAIFLFIIKIMSLDLIFFNVVGFLFSVILLIFMVIFITFIVPFVSIRIRLEREIQKDKEGKKDSGSGKVSDDKDFPRSSFWDAFPFASLVFFFVTCFMVLDVTYSNSQENDSPEILLVKLSFYLVGAVVTGIVVLFGAHIIKFESSVTALTKDVEHSSKKTNDAVNKIDEFSKKTEKASTNISDFIRAGTDINKHLKTNSSLAGLAILSLRSDVEYKTSINNLSNIQDDYPLDRYIASRSGQALMSDEAICRNTDYTSMGEDYFLAARNMVSTILDEIAWGFGERCLVTNARNYTNALVGVARGFEQVIIKKREKEGNAKNWRVFYLTHTIISPAHLLNWPGPIESTKELESGSICRVHPFMFDYMTYCRYFAAERDTTFIHARLIRTLKDTGETTGRKMAITPQKFDSSVFNYKKAERRSYHLPRYCNKWGIPVWSIQKIGNGDKYHQISLYDKNHRMANPSKEILCTNNINDPCHIYLYNQFPKTERFKTELIDNGKPALFWPLYNKSIEDNNSDKDNAGKKPDLKKICNDLQEFLTSPNLKDGLLKDYNDTDDIGAHKKSIINREIELFQEAVEQTKLYDEKDSVKIASDLLYAYEQLVRIRWGFHTRSNEDFTCESLDYWEDMQTAIMMLVNVFMSLQVKSEDDKLMDFLEWFSETFHSKKEFGRYYLDEDIVEYSDDNDVGDKSQWKKLINEEFALIGIIELPDEDAKIDNKFISDSLEKWIKDEKNSGIKNIMGLRSSIQVPWRNAEIDWYWPVSNEEDEVKRLALYYNVGMKKSQKINS